MPLHSDFGPTVDGIAAPDTSGKTTSKVLRCTEC